MVTGSRMNQSSHFHFRLKIISDLRFFFLYSLHPLNDVPTSILPHFKPPLQSVYIQSLKRSFIYLFIHGRVHGSTNSLILSLYFPLTFSLNSKLKGSVDDCRYLQIRTVHNFLIYCICRHVTLKYSINCPSKKQTRASELFTASMSIGKR